MVSFTVRMRFTDEDHEKVEGLLRVLTEESRKEPGCVSYIAHFVEGNPEFVLIYEQYADQAAVEAHRATDHFKQYAIGGLYQLMKDREVENLIAVS
jgi:quinol monooxygenase YgiN